MSEPVCVEDGCIQTAEAERPLEQGSVVELVCHDHEAPTH